MIQSIATRSAPAGQRGPTRWQARFDTFHACHRREVNVAMHFVTTSLGLLGAIAVIHSLSGMAATVLVAAYALSLFLFVPPRVALVSTATLAGLLVAAFIVNLGVVPGLVLVALAYGAQDLAHKIADEPTYQSGYMGKKSWAWKLAEHTYLLLPLVLETAARTQRRPLAFLVPPNRVHATGLESDLELEDLQRIATFVARENPPLDHTTHWWQLDLPDDVSAAFRRLASSPTIEAGFRRALGDHVAVDILPLMNELYVTGPPRERTSDTVFYTPHIDGPFAVYPFCSVFRCMLAATPNTRVRTHFPMKQVGSSPGHLLTTGQALAFDFNREPHYITSAVGPARERRVNLKIHYLVYPRGLRGYARRLGEWTTRYDHRARQLFLDTLKPNGLVKRLAAGVILALTRLFVFLEERLGLNNLALIACIGLGAALCQNYTLFLFATSFVHYLIYIAALRFPRDICYGRFTRNTVFFKILALAQLVALYLISGDFNLPSLGLIIAGFGLSAAAFARLGMVRSYLGSELGQCPPLHVTGFPYNVIPHPMVLGAIVGMLGLGLSAPLRERFWWLIPLHVLFYLAYLVVEVRQARAATPPDPKPRD